MALTVMHKRPAQSEAEAGHKSIGGTMIVATVFRDTVRTEIVGSLDAEIDESAAPAPAGEAAGGRRTPRRKGMTAAPKPEGRR